jgi:hypothetical protein
MNGSFYGKFKDEAEKVYYGPCSICVAGGKIIQALACHYWQDFPESVLYGTEYRTVSISRVKKAEELPERVVWAVGGLGLLDNYNPDDEGLKKIGSQDFSDVLRDTNHALLGVKNGYIYLAYCASMTVNQVNEFAKKLGLELAIMLDGGHIAGINGSEPFARINTSITQYYVIQAV